MKNDFYASSKVYQTIAPVSASGQAVTGTAISTEDMDGVINLVVESSAMTTETIAGVVQVSGAAGWASDAGTFTLASGTLVASSYCDSRNGSWVRPVITVTGGPITVSSILIAPLKDSEA